ncbi:metal ABC transporter permease [Candidatus Uhrbacteria bacterium]|nr:metal ABC transporter permease [Candidatus Uhrbacteria bacterium]
MQKALVAGLALGAVLPFLGTFVTLRKLSFLGDGIAHASLAGIAIGIVAAVNPFPVALAVGVSTGILVYILERKTSISSDALVGVLFTGALSFGLILMSMQRGYQPELLSFLFGNILSIRAQDLWVILPLSAGIIGVLITYFRQFALLALDRETAGLYRVNTSPLDLLFYILVSVAIVLGVKLLGVILVSALLIVPPSIAKMIARSFRKMVVWSIVGAECFVILGLALSYMLDWPSGATIVLVGAGAFLLIAAMQGLTSTRRS